MCFVCVVYVNMLQNASLKEQPIAEQICISNYYDYDYDYNYALIIVIMKELLMLFVARVIFSFT